MAVHASCFSFLFKHSNVFLAEVLTNLVLLLVTVLNDLLVSSAVNEVGGRAQVAKKESSRNIDCLVVLAVNNVEELVAVVLVRSDRSKDLLLDLSVGDTALKRSIFSFEGGANIFSDLGHINDFTTGAFTDNTSDEGFAGKGLTENNGPLSLVAKMLIEGALIPGAHGL